MLSFAFKNLLIKKLNAIFIIISIMLSAGTALLAFNTAEQVSDGITNTAGYYSVVIGPSGSSTQLVMNTMYFAESPIGTIPYEICYDLEKDTRVREVIPFAMADSYEGFSCVGTTSSFLSTKSIKEGKMFDDTYSMEAVLGYNVARTCDINVGDVIYTSHSVGVEHKSGMKVVGILERTHTSYDNVVFTEIKSIWELHEEEHEDGEDHDHEEMNGMVCAILVKTMNPGYAMTITTEYNGKTVNVDGSVFSLQACEPMSIVRNILEDTNTTKYIVYVLCGIILVMSILIVFIITLLNLNYSKEEIKLMRLIGISMKKISFLYMIENGIIGIISAVLALFTSKLCSGLMGEYVESMGVVLNNWRIYPAEFLILISVIVITIIPTMICTSVIGKKDAI